MEPRLSFSHLHRETMVCADEWVIHKEQDGLGPSVDQTAQIESLKR